jgi:hypothetical protein
MALHICFVSILTNHAPLECIGQGDQVPFQETIQAIVREFLGFLHARTDAIQPP